MTEHGGRRGSLKRGGVNHAARPSAAAVAMVMLASCAVVAVTGQPVAAAGATVTKVEDTDGVCEPGDCSLREAIKAGTSLIDFAPGVSGQISLFEELPPIGHDVTIAGPGADALTVIRQGGPDFRILTVSGGVSAEISGLTIRNGSFTPGGGILSGTALEEATLVVRDVDVRGNAGGRGGGIASYGELTVEDSIVRDNTATLPEGGGGILSSGGTLVVRNSAIRSNQAPSSAGGGIRTDAGRATIADSTISQNTGGGLVNDGADVLVTTTTVDENDWAIGAGIANRGGTLTVSRSTVSSNNSCQNLYQGGGGLAVLDGTLHVVNSTVSGNETCSRGGGIDVFNSGRLLLENSTVAANRAVYGGTNLDLNTENGEAVVRSSILSNPLGGGANCLDTAGTLISQGYNLADDASCGFNAPGDQPVADALLAPLADYGGPTHTMALGEQSPAIDKGKSDGLATDQRGMPRTVDLPDIVNAPGGDGTDIGAFEVSDGEEQPEVPPLDPVPAGVHRLAGATRVETAIEISRDSFGDGAASAVVLARSDAFADALVGTPLAVDRGAPVLLTPPDSLLDAVAAEMQRVLPAGGTVYLLGGEVALSDAVAATAQSFGFDITRLDGPTRVETAIAVAGELGDADPLLITTGFAFPDALAAGAAAAHTGGAVLLTTPDEPHPAVDTYLAGRDGATVHAVGGPAVRAYPAAAPVSGPGREDTAVRVAEEFFDGPQVIGIARRDDFPDALAGGAHIARLGGPLLLTASDSLHPVPTAYLCSHSATLTAAYVYGGTSAVSAPVAAITGDRLQGTGCP